MRDAYPSLRDAGADLLALSAEPPPTARQAVAALPTPYPFPILSDPTLATITPWGIADPAETDDAGRPIARPALFLLDRAGIVRFAHVGEYARDRPSLPSLLLALETIP